MSTTHLPYEAVTRVTKNVNVEDFDRMIADGEFALQQRKVELIRGELQEMNPAGPVHDDLIQYLIGWSHKVGPQGYSVTAQTGLDLSELVSRPEPDLMWIKAGRYRSRHPSPSDIVLAIEVADSSLIRDRGLKAQLYAEAGISEYWIVSAKEECVYVFRDPQKSGYQSAQSFAIDKTISPLVAPDATLDLFQMFRGD